MSLGLLHLLSSPFLSSLFFELKHSLQFVSGLSVCPEIFSWWDYAECFMWLIEFTFLRFPSGSLSRSLLLYWSHSNPALSSLICSVIFLYFLGINWFFDHFFEFPILHYIYFNGWGSLLPENYECFDQPCCLLKYFLCFCVEIGASVGAAIFYVLCESLFGDQCSLDKVFWTTHCFEAVIVFPKRSLLYSYPVTFLFVILFWQCVLPGAGGSWILCESSTGVTLPADRAAVT